MASKDAREVVGTLLKDTWGNAHSARLAWPNRSFDPPQNAPWVRVTILDGEGRQLTIGDQRNLHRSVGLLVLQVFVPANTGDFVAREIADSLADLFRAASFDGATDEVVRFRSPAIRTIGIDGAYFQVNCEIPLYRDSVV